MNVSFSLEKQTKEPTLISLIVSLTWVDQIGVYIKTNKHKHDDK